VRQLIAADAEPRSASAAQMNGDQLSAQSWPRVLGVGVVEGLARRVSGIVEVTAACGPNAEMVGLGVGGVASENGQ
jgi:hypothetical protein